ncbi:hypothetical protein [Pontibacter litorisediminis]|uniref:hypothetical protein n=1 Tax=Pontibacter litorisediminis TaxID=1846260 RepID=UPI0023ECAA69|nr:hypothetical protein [Pontibacter litorisediminis]
MTYASQPNAPNAIVLHLLANTASPTNLAPTGALIFTIVRALVVLTVVLAWKRKGSIKERLVV